MNRIPPKPLINQTLNMNIMKKFLFTLFLTVLGTSAYAQKSYVTMVSYHGYTSATQPNIYLTGDLPSNVSEKYTSSTTGDVINLLAASGFSVEHHSMSCASSGFYQTFILSKSSTSSPSKIERVTIDSNEEVTEVARYNLQGMPIGKNEKGIQIVVYSNYTTKTIIVE